MDAPPARNWKERLALVVIVLIAGVLRLAAPDLTEFKADEAVAIDMALPIVDGQSLPVTGLMSSVGIQNPPAFIYLVALPLALRPTAIAAVVFVGLLNTLAVLGTYVCLRRPFGPFIALTSAALFATAPWAVVFSRKIWAQDLVAPLTVLLLACLLAVIRRRTWIVGAVPVVLVVLAQLHFSAFSLGPVVAVALLLALRTLHWKALAIGTAIAVASLLPYMHYQTTHGWQQVRGMSDVGRADLSSVSLTTRPIVYTTDIVGARRWSAVMGSSDAALTAEAPAARRMATAASVCCVVLLLCGVALGGVRVLAAAARAGRHAVAESDVRRHLIVVTWLAGIWLLFIAARIPHLFTHYFVVTYPVAFVAVALALDVGRQRLAKGMGPAATYIASGVVLVLCASFVTFDIAYLRFLDRHGGARGDFGVALRDKLAAARYAATTGLAIDGDVEFQTLLALEQRADRARTDPVGSTGVLTVRNGFHEQLPCAPDRLMTFGPLLTCTR